MIGLILFIILNCHPEEPEGRREDFIQNTKIGFFSEYRYLCIDVKPCIVRNLIHKLALVLVSALLMTLGGCKKMKEISVTSVEIEAISPKGLQGINVFLAVGIDNPSIQISLENINGSLKHSGKVLGRVTMDPFVVQARSAEIYHLRAFVTLGEDATLKDLIMLTDMEKLKECTVDVSATPRLKGGLGAPITLKNIPFEKLL